MVKIIQAEIKAIADFKILSFKNNLDLLESTLRYEYPSTRRTNTD